MNLLTVVLTLTLNVSPNDLSNWEETNTKLFFPDLDPVSISKCCPALFHPGRIVGDGRRGLADPT